MVDVTPAWVELFGHEEATALLGQPLMDFFQQRSHAALKGALVATAQGRWANHSLQAIALMPAGTELPVQIEFERFEFEGEPAVRMRVPTQTRDLETLTRQLDEALQFDTTTGLMKRAAFVEECRRAALGFPDVAVDEVIVDTMAMRLIRDPQSFDTVVTTSSRSSASG